jgi:hypothetical protein
MITRGACDQMFTKCKAGIPWQYFITFAVPFLNVSTKWDLTTDSIK